MNPKHDTALKLLPKVRTQDAEKDDAPQELKRSVRFLNIGLAFVTALLLAVILIPRVPHLRNGDIAERTIVAPHALSLEYPGTDQTLVSVSVEKGEVLVEAGQRVSDKAARALEEIARHERAGARLNAYGGLSLLFLLMFYLFYRDIKRYRPALIAA